MVGIFRGNGEKYTISRFQKIGQVSLLAGASIYLTYIFTW